MVEREEINGKIFIEQTSYYIYNSEEDRKKDEWEFTTSNKKEFEKEKKRQIIFESLNKLK